MRSPFGVRKKIRELKDEIQKNAGMASGSPGAQRLQQKYDTGPQARDFYKNRVYDHIRPHMVEYIAQQRQVFLATADKSGDCDCSLKMGRPGFVRVLDDKTVAIPLYPGNGVHMSLGNVSENPGVSLCFFSPEDEFIAYQINGRAEVVEAEEMAGRGFHPAELPDEGRWAVRWLVVRAHETFARCNRHRLFVEDEEASSD